LTCWIYGLIIDSVHTAEGKSLKIVIVVLLFAVSAVAQNSSAAAPAACGSMSVSYAVKLDGSQRTLAQPEPGKARLYFMQDSLGIGGAVVTMIGVDGAWVGANRNSSNFSVSVEAGEHHLCVNPKSMMAGRSVELAHFTAEAGKVYYFRTRTIVARDGVDLFLEQADSDEAASLIAAFPLSISHPKK
jgi:hypothetical protein